MTTGSPKSFLFTVDVEDWFQVENFKPSIPFDTWNDRELRVERNTCLLLDLFDEMGARCKEAAKNGRWEEMDIEHRMPNVERRMRNNIKRSEARSQKFNGPEKQLQPTAQINHFNQQTNSTNKPLLHATFFVLGWIARKLPGLVKEISSRGHEVASHGINHHLCNHETSDALQKDLADSKKLLEDIIGGSVYGYRAPSFSINGDILKIIEDAGYLYDSSYNSFDKHGRYGKLAVSGFQKSGIAYQVSDTFYELPISNLTLQPVLLPWGGGGYFRLTPYVVFKKGIQRILDQEGAYSFYLHPWEVDPQQPRVEKAAAFLKLRHYLNLRSTAKKVRKMLDDFSGCRFVTCREYVETLATERL